MKRTRRVFKNVPVFVIVVLMAFGAASLDSFLAAFPARAAEESNSQGLNGIPPDVTPEQVEAVKKMLQTNAEAKKALEERRKQAEAAKGLQKNAETKETEAAKQAQATKVETKPAPVIYDWKASTYVGNLFLKRLSGDEAGTLIHFGHEIFNPTPGAALVLENMPVAPGYVIGPGDEIIVKLWGRVEGTHRMVVDRDGKILFPKIGSLYVAGKTFEELKSFLKGKASTIAEVSSDVTLGQMKGIRVSVVGEARSPGWFNVSSLHTALQALSMAGGVKDIGSLRRILIHRGGKAVEEIDLYDFLLKGDSRSDIRLLQADTIFVPVVGKLAAIAGEVRRPAIYELREEKTLLDLVKMAGGFAPSAYKKRVQVERLEGHVAKIVLDADADELEKGARITDLVKLAGDLTKSAYPPQAEIVRVDPKRNFHTVYFDLGRALAGDEKENIVLEDEDQVRIHSIWESKYKKAVNVDGEVNAPGEYVLTEGMRLSDLLFKAGGLKEGAYVKEAELVRREVAPGGELVKTQAIPVAPERALAGDEKANLTLKEYDLLVIRKIPEWGEKIQVTLAGEVRFPGGYTARKGERLSSLVSRAGGFTANAYLKAAQFTRTSTQKAQQEAIDKLIEDLELEVAQKAQAGTVLDKEDIEANKELLNARRSLIAQLRKAKAKGRVVIRLAEADKLKGSPADILLEDGDRLEVPKKMNVVNVVGRVYNPTGVVFDPASDRLEDYLRMAGGPTASADRDHIFLIKADGSVVTRDNNGSFL